MHASGRLHRVFRYEVVGLLLLATVLLIVTLAPRVLFPWPLEWMEGAVLHHALRLGTPDGIYGPPAADFIPYLYPPLSYLPVRVFTALLGDSLPVARG